VLFKPSKKLTHGKYDPCRLVDPILTTGVVPTQVSKQELEEKAAQKQRDIDAYAEEVKQMKRRVGAHRISTGEWLLAIWPYLLDLKMAYPPVVKSKAAKEEEMERWEEEERQREQRELDEQKKAAQRQLSAMQAGEKPSALGLGVN